MSVYYDRYFRDPSNVIARDQITDSYSDEFSGIDQELIAELRNNAFLQSRHVDVDRMSYQVFQKGDRYFVRWLRTTKDRGILIPGLGGERFDSIAKKFFAVPSDAHPSAGNKEEYAGGDFVDVSVHPSTAIPVYDEPFFVNVQTLPAIAPPPPVVPPLAGPP